MIDTLTASQALASLAETWESDAETISRYRPDAGDAQVLKRCARDLRRIAGDHTPEWVPLRAVRARTGRSLSYLYRTCQELRATGRARRTSRGSWELSLESALEIPSRRGHAPVEPGDLQEMARALARETNHGTKAKGLESHRWHQDDSHEAHQRGEGLRAAGPAGPDLHDPGVDHHAVGAPGGEAAPRGDDEGGS